MRDTLAIILAGGVGSRLSVLVGHRAKPAVPFGGVYRIIDFALSNCMNSGLSHAAVLTQYKPLSLMRHIGTGEAWDFVGRTRGIKILPPRTGHKDSDWYKGTADAVRQNIDFIESRPSKEILILSGDHIYFMNYKDMVLYHRSTGAKVTVAMMPVPWEQTHHFGIGIVDEQNRIVDWEEKPKHARSNLASMGIYVFDTEYLLNSLRQTKEEDFGHHLIPMAREQRVLYAYRFDGYWRDVGTVHAYWDANLDLLRSKAELTPELWGICTNHDEEDIAYDRPPIKILPCADVQNCSLSPGCIISGAVKNSVLSPGVIVEKNAVVTDSVLMHDCIVKANARVARTVADKKAVFGKDSITGIGDSSKINILNPKHLSTGLSLVGKEAEIPAKARIGTNCCISPALHIWPDPPVLEDGETI